MSAQNLSILFSCISLIISVVHVLLTSRKDRWDIHYKEDERQSKKILEEQNQKNQNKIEQLNETQIRSKVIPFFHLDLNDKEIKFNKDSCIAKINLINIGKDSATNIRLCPLKNLDGSQLYFCTKNKNDNPHFVYNYLNKSYACPRDVITFETIVKGNNEYEYIVDFKIQFDDLLGNTYEQNFELGYSNQTLHGFSMRTLASIPKLINSTLN